MGYRVAVVGATGNVGPVNGFSDNVEVYRKSGRQLGIEASRVRMDIDPLPRTETLVEIRPSGAELGIYEDIPVGEADSSLSIVNNDVNFPVREYPSVEQAQTDFDKQKANLVKARSTNDVEEVAAAAAAVAAASAAASSSSTFVASVIWLSFSGGDS